MKINLDAYMTIDFWRYINPLYGSMCICDADSSLWLYLHAVTSAVQRIPETAYTVRCGVTIVQCYSRSSKLAPIESQYATSY